MTKDKTVTMSRDLAEKVDDVLYIMTGEDSYQQLVHKYGTGWWGALTEMRAELRGALAAPVVERQPVAWLDEESGALATDKLKPLVEGFDIPLYISPVSAVTPQQLIDAIQTEQSRLTAEDYLMDSDDCIAVIRELACLDKVKEMNQ